MHPLLSKLLTSTPANTNDLIKEQIKLHASITALPVGFVIVDSSEGIQTINPAAQLIIGSLVVPTKLSQLPRDLTDMLRTHCQTVQQTQRVHEENEVTYGSKFLKLYFAPIIAHGTRSEYLGTVIVMEDVTEAKILERSKDEFFSIASHELRTPLTAIRGNTSMMMDMYADKLSDPDLSEMVHDIYDSSVRLIGIVNDFLNMSRLEQGKIEYKKESFDMVALAKEVTTELVGAKTHPSVSLVVKEPSVSLPNVVADRNKTKEIIINLVGNALKCTESGSIELSFAAGDQRVKLFVTDTGRGMSPENQTILFHKFQQASDNILVRDTSKGTGLGLYISKLMIEGMGGRIWLERSEIGKGSTFAIDEPTG